MKRTLLITTDGSKTLHLPKWKENYHSSHGAIQEAQHIFIYHGLDMFKNRKELSILEVGYGTGLNAFLTFLTSNQRMQRIQYTAIEKYPIYFTEWQALNHLPLLKSETFTREYRLFFESPWGKFVEISAWFQLEKILTDLIDFTTEKSFDLIYYDAFSPKTQPQLWQRTIFEYLFTRVNHDGLLVTYSAKGEVRRTLQAAGFVVEKCLGPPGKREISQAWKK